MRKVRLRVCGERCPVVRAATFVLYLTLTVVPVCAQPTVQRVLGTVRAVEGNAITLQTDAGAESKIGANANTKVVRLEPGQTDLKSAKPATLQDIQPGDRILARGSISADGSTLVPTLLVLMKASDVAQRREQERLQWQHGLGGLVKSVDPNIGDIVIMTAALPARAVTIHTTKQTVFRRYAPSSVKFEDAKPSSIAAIKPGDQLRARGTKNPDGNELTADEVVSGSFRNIAGTVIAADEANSTVTIMDLASKKPETVKITPDSQVRQLPPMMARMLAMRLRGGANEGSTQQSAEREQSRRPAGEPNSPAGRGGIGGARPVGNGGDLQQMLNRLPTVSLAELQKGEAVMLVATEGAEPQQLTAITMLTGVEPILAGASAERPASSLLSPWSLGGGGGEDLGGGTQ